MTETLTLHQFEPLFGEPNLSPFCMKLESWLRLAGVPYTVAPVGDMSAAPKGKAPWIVDTDGTVLADSTLIIEHLKRTRGVDPDADLPTAHRLVAVALSALLEERLYFAMAWSRWIPDAAWAVTRPAYFPDLPRHVAETIREETRQALHHQGIGRHSAEEIAGIATRDIDTLAGLLGDKPWLFGDRPVTADCTAYAFAANLLVPQYDTPLRRAAERHANLRAYVVRARREWFPELMRAA
ncbi:MAG TPA: glutathione S-transferase family protein [Azospirillaceae bacterium]|nr:glutathione S-transferase family protein [Azospirillaceae bacterium]